MIFRNRPLARIGAAALLVSGGLAALGAPAYASGTEADLSLDVVGTKVAANSPGKVAFAKVTNNDQNNTPATLVVDVDTSKVDLTKVAVEPFAGDVCEPDEKGAHWTCDLPADLIPGPGQTVEIPLFVFKTGEGLTGTYTAPVEVSITSPDDNTPDNNRKTVDIVLSEESGVDLTVLVPDVKVRYDLTEDEDQPTSPLYPGDTTAVLGLVANQGDVAAKGLKVTLRLPKGVTFAQESEGCEYTADKRTATCTDDELVLSPDDLLSVGWPVTVGADVKAPVTLPEGSLAAEALGELPADSPLALQAGHTKLANAKVLTGDEAKAKDFDGTDNVDGFAVVVAAKGGAGGGGGDEELPLTGVQTGLIGGVGLVVVVAGVVVFLAARRRRVVLVAPEDEKPTA